MRTVDSAPRNDVDTATNKLKITAFFVPLRRVASSGQVRPAPLWPHAPESAHGENGRVTKGGIRYR